MMINKLKPKSEFSRNVLTLMTGTTVAQAIPIAVSPILTRIYTPEDFGVFALFIAITAIFGSVVSGKYELAIMIPKKDEDAINIFVLGCIITCLISLILLIIIVLFNDFFTMILNNDEISSWLYFIPLAVLFSGLFNVLNYFNNRKKYYYDLRNATIIKSMVLAIVQLSIGFLRTGATGLITGSIISNMFANIKLFKNITKDKILISKVSKKQMIELAKKYKNFPKYNLPSTLADAVVQQLPFLLIPKIFSLSISGYFSLSQKLISLPSSLIAKSISQVYYQKISENINNNIKNINILISTIKKLILIALPISIFIFLFASDLFRIIFGESWILSGEIAKYLSLIFFITFIVSTLSITLVAYESLKKLANWQYLYLISSLTFYLICYYYKFTFEKFLFYFVIHEYIMYMIYLYLIIKTVKEKDKKLC